MFFCNKFILRVTFNWVKIPSFRTQINADFHRFLTVTLYNNKYRIESTRLKNWDYTGSGYYFITICTGSRECHFGEINDNQINLSDIGIIADQFWRSIPEHYPNTILDEFTIMPNHVHGIIIIDHQRQNHRQRNTFSKPLSGSLSMIINHYKGAVTRWCKKSGISNFSWQPRFYENIIRDEKSLHNIRQYIINNPMKWEQDDNYSI